MKKTYYPLRKEYPELNLKVVIDENEVEVYGNKTLDRLVSQFSYIGKKPGFLVMSAMHPAVYAGENKFHICIGGRTINDPEFKIKREISPRYYKTYLSYLAEFEIKQLNKQITIL
jgi:hypothetical protein